MVEQVEYTVSDVSDVAKQTLESLSYCICSE